MNDNEILEWADNEWEKKYGKFWEAHTYDPKYEEEIDAIPSVTEIAIKKARAEGHDEGVKEERKRWADKLREKVVCIHVDHKTCSFSDGEICDKLRSWCIELQEIEKEIYDEEKLKSGGVESSKEDKTNGLIEGVQNSPTPVSGERGGNRTVDRVETRPSGGSSVGNIGLETAPANRPKTPMEKEIDVMVKETLDNLPPNFHEEYRKEVLRETNRLQKIKKKGDNKKLNGENKNE